MKSAYIDGLAPRRGKAASAGTKSTTPVFKKNMTNPLPRKQLLDPLEIEKIQQEKRSRTRIARVETVSNEPEVAAEDFSQTDNYDDFLEPISAFNLEKDRDQNEFGLDRDEKRGSLNDDDEIDINSEEIDEEINKDKKPKKKPFIFRHKKLCFFLVFLLVVGGVGYFYGNQIISKITGGKSNLFDFVSTMVSEKYTPLKTDANGQTNIAVFGTSGYDMSGNEGRGVHDGAQLTDSLMEVTLNQESKNANMISIPRDLKVGREACYAGKINEVYTCASNNGKNEEAGAQAVMNVLETVTGLKNQYYIHLNWGSLIQIVDALGGIEVTFDEDITDYGWTNIVIKKNIPTTLNGEKALALARARHGVAGGDFARGENQQRILTAVKEKIVKKGMDIPAMIALVNALGDNIRTNIKIDEMKTGAHLLSQFNSENMKTLPLANLPDGTTYVTNASYPVQGINISYVIPAAGLNNYTKIHQYVQKAITENVDSVATARLLVLNGSGERGAASDEKLELEKVGFKNIETDNAPTSDYQDITIYQIGEKPMAKKGLTDYYKIEVKDKSELPQGVKSHGYDFVIIRGKETAKKSTN